MWQNRLSNSPYNSHDMSLPSKILNAMFWDFLGKLGLVIVRFAESVLFVSLLGNSQYGILSIFSNLQSILLILSSLGLEGLISRFLPRLQTQPRSSSESFFLKQILWIRLSVLTGGLVLCFFATTTILSLQFPQMLGTLSVLRPWFYLTLVLVAVMSLQELFRRILVLYYHQRFINGIELLTTMMALLASVYEIQQGQGIGRVLEVNILFRTLVVIGLLLRAYPYFQFKNPHSLRIRLNHAGIFRYGGHTYLHAILIYILGKGSDIFILGVQQSDPQQITFYVVAYQLAFFASSIMELALQGGFVLPLVAQMVEARRYDVLRKIYTGLFQFIYLFTLPITIGGLVLASYLMRTFYGEANQQAVSLFMVLLFHFAITKMGILNSCFLLTSSKPENLTRARVFFSLFNIGINWFLAKNYGAIGVVWGTCLIGIGGTLWETWKVHPLIHPNYPLKFLKKIMMASTVMGGVVWGGIHFLPPSPALRLVVGTTLGLLVYLGVLSYLKPISAELLEVFSKFPFKKQLRSFMETPED